MKQTKIVSSTTGCLGTGRYLSFFLDFETDAFVVEVVVVVIVLIVSLLMVLEVGVTQMEMVYEMMGWKAVMDL